MIREGWGDDRIAELRRLFDDGLSCGQIAAEMGIGRNAIIGKLHRLGLNRGRVPARPRSEVHPGRRRGFGFNKRRAAELAKPLPKPAPAPAPLRPRGPPCGLLELTNGKCRWPVTAEPPHLFCGEPEADFPERPYCPYHTRRASRRFAEPEAA